MLLPTFTLHICQNYCSTWIGKRLLPTFLSIIKSLDALLGSHKHLKKWNEVFTFHSSASIRDILQQETELEKDIAHQADLQSMDPPTFSKTLMSGKIRTIDDHKTAVVVSNKGAKFHTILTYDGVRSGVHSWDFKINNSSIYIGVFGRRI